MTENDQLNLDAVRRFYQAEQDVAAPDIVWHVPGHNPVSGAYRGQAEYVELMPSRMEPLDGWDITLRSLMVNGGLVVSIFHLEGERRGSRVSMDGQHVLRLHEEHQVVEAWGFAADQHQLDRFVAA